MIIDSGSSCNVIDDGTWRLLKNDYADIRYIRTGSDRSFKAYVSHTLLEVLYTFDDNIDKGERKVCPLFSVLSRPREGEGGGRGGVRCWVKTYSILLNATIQIFKDKLTKTMSDRLLTFGATKTDQLGFFLQISKRYKYKKYRCKTCKRIGH